MYVPPAYAERRPDVVFDFIEAHPLGAIVSRSTNGLTATHLPFVLDRTRGPLGTLQGHFARANAHHQILSEETEALLIFTGPQAYVTPSWYESKQRHGKVVPTWDYVAVHVYGVPRVIDDIEFLRRHVTELSAQREFGRADPWAVSDAPSDFIEQLLPAIVGVELQITRFEAQWKASQNRPAQDIAGVVAGLSASPVPSDREMAAIVSARAPRA